ncbi:MAG: B12-binding domain-containing radical SAM protein [Candidatus Scalindua sp.]
MKVILINPSFNRYGGVVGHGGNMIPLNLCCLVAYTRLRHPDVEFKIIDSEIKGLSHEDTVKETQKFSPDLIGITSNTCVFDSVIRLVFLLSEKIPDVPIVIGGPHPSALPERTLKETEAKFVVFGEGELTFEELIEYHKEGNSSWNKINGLAYKSEDGHIRTNPPRELIKDLDILPFPARDLVECNLYVPPPTKRVAIGPNTILSTSRGCTHNCGFCAANTVWTRKIRFRSPKLVVDEIVECVEKFGIRSFNFTDEYFTALKKRVLEICRILRERKLQIRWVCSARAQRIDRETLEAMRDAGCYEISFGIESGNNKILKKIDKSIDLDEALRVIRLTKKVGITTHASYILGYLDETEETMKDTIRFAKKLNTHIAAFFIASPLPGTPLYHEALEKGYIRSDANWQDFSPLSNTESVLSFPELSIATIRKWHRKALKSYYVRPKYIISRLLTIRHWYEVLNLLGGLKIFFQIKK